MASMTFISRRMIIHFLVGHCLLCFTSTKLLNLSINSQNVTIQMKNKLTGQSEFLVELFMVALTFEIHRLIDHYYYY